LEEAEENLNVAASLCELRYEHKNMDIKIIIHSYSESEIYVRMQLFRSGDDLARIIYFFLVHFVINALFLSSSCEIILEDIPLVFGHMKSGNH